MLTVDATQVVQLPVDKLALLVLADLVDVDEWHEGNYLLKVKNQFGRGKAVHAVGEALGWLRARNLIALDGAGDNPLAIFVTRSGHQVLRDGPTRLFATERLQAGSHPLVEKAARPQFLLGEFELAVFASMKAVEVRVRDLGGFDDGVYGVDLMNKAFGPSGPLTDPGSAKGEVEGTRFLFAGAYSVFRNPSGHQNVNFDDVTEAAEIVQTASVLMRILDRVEARLNS